MPAWPARTARDIDPSSQVRHPSAGWGLSRLLSHPLTERSQPALEWPPDPNSSPARGRWRRGAVTEGAVSETSVGASYPSVMPLACHLTLAGRNQHQPHPTHTGGIERHMSNRIATALFPLLLSASLAACSGGSDDPRAVTPDEAVWTSYPQDQAIGCQIQVQKVWREHSPLTLHLSNE